MDQKEEEQVKVSESHVQNTYYKSRKINMNRLPYSFSYGRGKRIFTFGVIKNSYISLGVRFSKLLTTGLSLQESIIYNIYTLCFILFLETSTTVILTEDE